MREHDNLIEKEWQLFQAQRESLRDRGAQETFAVLPGFEKAFVKNPKHVAVLCIDEGCTGEGTHLAGSGCGISEEQLMAELKAAGVTEFTTHEGCGAWALAHPELDEATEREEAVTVWGARIAHQLGVPHRHIAAAEMKRPAEIHNAFYALYDGTGSFNRDSVPEMGPGFVTSPKHFASAKDNLELAVKIAFGAHGLGEKFSAEDPFVLIGIVNPTDAHFSKERIIADLTSVQEKFPTGKVKIDVIELPV